MPRSTQVHKFGGASLATAEAMAHAVSIVLANRSAPIVVVVSALAGVTDALLDIATKGLRAGGGATALRRKHSALARALFTGARRKELISGVVAVVPGFIGATPDGQITTLGRGGSDLTATLLARALGAGEVSLWKDVPG